MSFIIYSNKNGDRKYLYSTAHGRVRTLIETSFNTFNLELTIALIEEGRGFELLGGFNALIIIAEFNTIEELKENYPELFV